MTPAESWLSAQQCSDGGWTSYVTSTNPCNGKPADFEGPDTNSTALAVEGLEAQHALGATAAAEALHFLTKAQDADGGWGYEPNTAKAPGSTDPDSTALVFQALLALGTPPSTRQAVQAADPVAVLDSFQITSGSRCRRPRLPRHQRSQPAGHVPGRPGARRRDLRLRPGHPGGHPGDAGQGCGRRRHHGAR